VETWVNLFYISTVIQFQNTSVVIIHGNTLSCITLAFFYTNMTNEWIGLPSPSTSYYTIEYHPTFYIFSLAFIKHCLFYVFTASVVVLISFGGAWLHRSRFFQVAFFGPKLLDSCLWLTRYIRHSLFPHSKSLCLSITEEPPFWCNSGWERWQDNCCMCWWSRVSSLQWYQGPSSPPFSWNPSLFWGLYPFQMFQNVCSVLLIC